MRQLLHNQSAFWLSLTIAILGCSSHREVDIQEHRPEDVIKVDHSLRIKQGRDIPESFSCPIDDLLKYAPSETKVVGRVVRSATNKFTLSMDWTFTGNNPAFWRLYPFSDPNDGTVDFIPGDRITPGGDGNGPRDRFSSELQGGRIYKFELVAQVDCYKGTAHHIVEGLLVTKTITVDLRDL